MQREVPTTPLLALVSRRLARLRSGGPTGLTLAVAGVACALGVLFARPNLALPLFDDPGGRSSAEASRAEALQAPHVQSKLKTKTANPKAAGNASTGSGKQPAGATGGRAGEETGPDPRGPTGEQPDESPDDTPNETPDETPMPLPMDQSDDDPGGHHQGHGEPGDADRDSEAGENHHDPGENDRPDGERHPDRQGSDTSRDDGEGEEPAT